MISVVICGPMYRESVSSNSGYIHRPTVGRFDSLDSEAFALFQEQYIEEANRGIVYPVWTPDSIRLEIDGDDINKLDMQFINLPRPVNAKTRFYTGDMALFIIMNYTVNA